MPEEGAKEYRAKVLKKMDLSASSFYANAIHVGCHTWIEFTGLMTEFLNICWRAHANGIDFTQASTHTGEALPIETFEAEYLAEKLNCIYGPALLSNERVRDAFIAKLFDGEYKAVKA